MGTTPLPLDGPGPQVTDSRELLLGYLGWYREALRRKLSGLSEAQLRTPVEPFGWAPLGLVQHLGWVERRWLRWGLAAEDVLAYPAGGDTEEWGITQGTGSAEVFAAYQREVDAGAGTVAAAGLAEPARVGGRFRTAAEAPTLVRILFHLLQEYARHLGQLDLVRELLDGTTGE